jgi:hypothetical protein
MSLSTNVSNLATRVATEIKAVRTLVNGNASDLSALTTTAKNNLVAAINELDAALAAVDLTDLIDDNATATTTTWSSTKIDSEIDAAVAALVDGAPGLLDTLNELAAALGDDENFATSVTTAISNAQDAAEAYADSLASNYEVAGAAAAAEAAANLYTDGEILALETAIGDTTTNYVTTFEAGLV